MYCGRCGNELPEGATFCGKCGSPVSGQPKKKEKKTGFIIGIVAAVLVLGLVIGGVVWYQVDQKAKWDREHQDKDVSLVFSIPNYQEKSSSGIPLYITGTDLDGNKVEKKLRVQPSEKSLKLKSGSYQVTAGGSPISGTGQIYTFSSDPQPLDLAVDDSSGSSSQNVDESVSLNYQPIPAAEVSDDQIQATRIWMKDYGVEQTELEACAQLVVDARQAELERIAQEQAAAERAKYHISTSEFDFDVPEYWWGRVDWEVGTSYNGHPRISFFLPQTGKDSNGSYKCLLLNLTVQNSGDQRTAGDYMTQTVFLDSGSKTVCCTVFNWIAYEYDAVHYPGRTNKSVSDSQIRELIDLATEGEYSFDRAKSLQKLSDPEMSLIAYHVRDSIVAPNISVH